jgi:hypothetical protein
LNADTDAALFKEFKDVLEYINEQDRLENIVPPEDEKRKRLANFESWFREQGGVANSVIIKHIDKFERGLFATKDIKSGETIVFVPESIVFDAEMGKNTDIGKLFVADKTVAEQRLRPIDYVAMGFLQEGAKIAKKDAGETVISIFKPYFEVLPIDNPKLGSQFTSEEIDMLRGTEYKNNLEAVEKNEHD